LFNVYFSGNIYLLLSHGFEVKGRYWTVQQIFILVQTRYQSELAVSFLYIALPDIRNCPLFQGTASFLLWFQHFSLQLTKLQSFMAEIPVSALLIPQSLQLLHCSYHYCVSLVVWTLQVDTG